MKSLQLPVMTAAQEAAWEALFSLHEQFQTGWVLVGGQMVHLHVVDRGETDFRATADADMVLDVRSDSHILEVFTRALHEAGFHSAGVSAEGYEHKWLRGDAQIDVLIPRRLGKSQNYVGVTGSPTVGTAGAQQAIDRAETFDVHIGKMSGRVRSPNFLGALVAKAAATATVSDIHRHDLADFLRLATLIRPSDHIETATNRDRHHLSNAIQFAHAHPGQWRYLSTLVEGLTRLEQALDREPKPRSAPNSK